MKPDDTSPVNPPNEQDAPSAPQSDAPSKTPQEDGGNPQQDIPVRTTEGRDTSEGEANNDIKEESFGTFGRPNNDTEETNPSLNTPLESSEPVTPPLASSDIPPSEMESTSRLPEPETSSPENSNKIPTAPQEASKPDVSTVEEESHPLPDPTSNEAWQAPETDPEPVDPTVNNAEHKRMNRWVIVIVILLVLAGIIAGAMFLLRKVAQPAEKASVKVGILMAFSGGSSNMGYGTMKGIQLAKKQLGADNIELVRADSKCDAATAKNAVKDLIDQGVVAIIGDGCSSASVAALPAANNSKTVMVSPAASSTALSIPNDYFFRVIPNDNYQSQFMASAIIERGLKTVAVMYTNEPYGSSMNKAFQEKFESLGGKVVATAYSEPDVIDLSQQMSLLKDANPEAVFIAPNSVVTATAVIKLAREAGITAPLFGADILYDDTVIKNAPKDSEGLTVSTFSTGTSIFKQMLRNEFQVAEQLYAAPQAYDAFEVIYRAVEQGARTGEDIKNALPSMQFTGMSTDIQFDQNGEVPGKDYAYDQLQVKNGMFSLVKSN